MRSATIAALLCVAGVTLVATSVLWPRMIDRRANWSDEQAVEYQQTAARAHRLAYQPEDQGDARKEADADFYRQRNELKAAQQRGQAPASLLWWLGFACGTVGIAWYAALRLGGDSE